jgi:small basic protein
MWAPVIGLLIGLVVGAVVSVSIPVEYARYTAVAILAALDSVLGAAKAALTGQYNQTIFVTGFFANTILAGLLTLLGDRLGVELYYAAIFAFGVRLFNNLALIRRGLLLRFSEGSHRV